MTTQLPISIKDFTITPIESWRISCDRCPQSGTVVTGDRATDEALAWASGHYRSYHAPVASHDAG